MFTIVRELLKAMRPALPPTIAAKRPETPKRRVALMAALPADLRLRLVDRALPSFDRLLKWVSAFRSLAAKEMARATRPLRLQGRQKIPALRPRRQARAFCWRDRRLSIPSRDRSAIARCLCFYRPKRNSSELSSPHRARPSVFSRAPPHGFVRKCRRAARGRSRQQPLRRKVQTKAQRRPTLKTAPAIGFVRDWPFQFTNFKDSARRGSRTGKSEVFPTMRK